jgi:signal transduction histidine kinase
MKDILHDVLEPVQSMLLQRDGKVRVVIDCDPNMYAMADRLRLNQVVLNLGRNSSKFVEEGFIRLGVRLVDDDVIQMFVEDSGPGIPLEKRKLLFTKYQESLDMLSQGTVRFLRLNSSRNYQISPNAHTMYCLFSQ